MQDWDLGKGRSATAKFVGADDRVLQEGLRVSGLSCRRWGAGDRIVRVLSLLSGWGSVCVLGPREVSFRKRCVTWACGVWFLPGLFYSVLVLLVWVCCGLAGFGRICKVFGEKGGIASETVSIPQFFHEVEVIFTSLCH